MNTNGTVPQSNRISEQDAKSSKYPKETINRRRQLSTDIITTYDRHPPFKRKRCTKIEKINGQVFYSTPVHFKRYQTKFSNERGQVFSGRGRRKKKKQTCSSFNRRCLLCCLLCSWITTILIGTLIATLVLNFTNSHSTTTVTATTDETTTATATTTTTTTATATNTGTTTVTTLTTVITTSVTTVSTITTETTLTTSTTTTITSETTTTIISTISASTICSTTAITTTITSTSLPFQCLNYTLNTDATRNAGYGNGSSCDWSLFTSSPTWVRFSGAAGTLLANCPVDAPYCSTNAPGWYSGIYPSTAGDTTNGTVCYSRPGNTCTYSNSILITNCNGYYVFGLVSPPVCNLRYCTI